MVINKANKEENNMKGTNARMFAIEIKPNRRALISLEIEIPEDDVQDWKQKFCDDEPIPIEFK